MALSANTEDYDVNSDFLHIRPQSRSTKLSNLPKESARKGEEHRKRSHHGRHHHSGRDRHQRRSKERGSRPSHSRHRHRSSHYSKENKGELGSRHSKQCKYDFKHQKDLRNSHGDLESHRKFEFDDRHLIIKTDEIVLQVVEHQSGGGSNDDDNDDNNENGGDHVKRKYEDSLEEGEEEEEEEDDDDDEEDGSNSSNSRKRIRVVSSEEESSENENSELSDKEPDLERFNDNDNNQLNSSLNKELNSEDLVESLERDGEEVGDNKLVRAESLIDETLPPYFPAIQGCRSVDEFTCLNRIEEGTYGVVYRFKDKRTDEIVALKRLKMEKEKEGFPITSLREINTLLKSQHPNIVTVREIVVGDNIDKIYIVMDYVEHDLKSLIELMRYKNLKFTPGEVKCLLRQLLMAVAHLHDNWILHRDLKTSNLLLSHKGILKVGDFGLAREYGSPLRPYTPIVVTLWYRAPELLLGTKEYSCPIDIWSVGCIFAELLLMRPFFTGKTEIEQINRIFKCLGTPNEKIWPGYIKFPAVQKVKFNNYNQSNLRKRFQMLNDIGINLLTSFLTYDPTIRITAEDALLHPYFFEFPLPIDPSEFTKWPAKSELGHKRALESSPKPPSGGEAFKRLEKDGDGFRISLEDKHNRPGAGFSLKF